MILMSGLFSPYDFKVISPASLKKFRLVLIYLRINQDYKALDKLFYPSNLFDWTVFIASRIGSTISKAP